MAVEFDRETEAMDGQSARWYLSNVDREKVMDFSDDLAGQNRC